jgi:hypothetical protein
VTLRVLLCRKSFDLSDKKKEKSFVEEKVLLRKEAIKGMNGKNPTFLSGFTPR